MSQKPYYDDKYRRPERPSGRRADSHHSRDRGDYEDGQRRSVLRTVPPTALLPTRRPSHADGRQRDSLDMQAVSEALPVFDNTVPLPTPPSQVPASVYSANRQPAFNAPITSAYTQAGQYQFQSNQRNRRGPEHAMSLAAADDDMNMGSNYNDMSVSDLPPTRQVPRDMSRDMSTNRDQHLSYPQSLRDDGPGSESNMPMHHGYGTSQRSVWPPPEARSVTGNVIAPGSTAVTPLALSADARELVQIKLWDFVSCMKYIKKHPAVLQEGPNVLQPAAKWAYGNDETDLGNRIIDRMLILQHFKQNQLSLKDFLHYLDDLDRHRDLRRDHKERYERLAAHFRQAGRADKLSQPARDERPPTDERRPTMGLPSGAFGHSAAPARRRESQTGSRPQQMSSASLASSMPLSDQAHGYDGGDYTYGMFPRASDNLSFQAGSNHPNASTPLSMDSGMYPHEVNNQRPDALPALQAGKMSALTWKTRDVEIQPRNTEGGTFNGCKFEPRKQDARNFFKIGRVFRLVWHSEAGANTPEDGAEYVVTRGPRGARIYSKLQWLVVVRQRKGYCICCPINTYGGRGLLKPGLQPDEIKAHAVIYADTEPPTMLRDEPTTDKDPIRVKMSAGRQPMHYASRVHFGQYHTVHWDNPIMDMGKVIEENRELLATYFEEETLSRRR